MYRLRWVKARLPPTHHTHTLAIVPRLSLKSFDVIPIPVSVMVSTFLSLSAWIMILRSGASLRTSFLVREMNLILSSASDAFWKILLMVRRLFRTQYHYFLPKLVLWGRFLRKGGTRCGRGGDQWCINLLRGNYRPTPFPPLPSPPSNSLVFLPFVL